MSINPPLYIQSIENTYGNIDLLSSTLPRPSRPPGMASQPFTFLVETAKCLHTPSRPHSPAISIKGKRKQSVRVHNSAHFPLLARNVGTTMYLAALLLPRAFQCLEFTGTDARVTIFFRTKAGKMSRQAW
eukprot:GEMP01069330.1.p2 GENE.GEMP01069330.1~~GEMP01069330.1.p2  ORF type:complete len:130 (-),score=9.93 GEMP01069330.1:375-764(-)